MEPQQSLTLIGVGGGGCQIAAAAVEAFGAPMRAFGVDTDAFAIRNIESIRCMLLGGTRLDGQGTAGDTVKGSLAAEEDLTIIDSHLQDVRVAVIVTTLGGGTGGGVTPLLLRKLADRGIATLCYALLPFSFEDVSRDTHARRALSALEAQAHTLVTVRQDDLLQDTAPEEATLGDILATGTRHMAGALTLFWRLLLAPNFIRYDLERLRMQLLTGGAASLLFGAGAGDARVEEAAAGLLHSPLGKRAAASLAAAQSVMLGVLAGGDLRLTELGDLVHKHLRGVLPAHCDVDVGTVLDNAREGRLFLVALVFDTSLRDTGHPAPPPSGELSMAAQPAPASNTARKPRAAKTPKDAGLFVSDRFKNVEKTLVNGVDFDEPAFVRQHITIER